MRRQHPDEQHQDDPRRVVGGVIPGSDGRAAFTLSGAEPSPIPVLIAVPHAGRGYTPGLLDRMRHPQLAALRLEDRHVDRLARRIAQDSGATLLIADAPRALIDLNRAPDDIDWSMIRQPAPGRPVSGASAKSAPPSPPSLVPPPPASTPLGDATMRRARGGLGLIPRRLPGIGELWRGPLDSCELEARIADVHVPYHAAIAGELAALRARWGAALLIDLHSMPSLPPEGGAPGAEFVIGDRFGASSDAELTAAAFRHFAAAARRAAHNRPYAGGYVLERHGRPRMGISALQIEIDRASYLDRRLVDPGDGLDEVASLLTGLVRDLAVRTSTLGTRRADWAEAAE